MTAGYTWISTGSFECCFVSLEQESQLEDERGKNERLKEEADLLRRKAQLLDQVSNAARCADFLLCIKIMSPFHSFSHRD